MSPDPSGRQPMAAMSRKLLRLEFLATASEVLSSSLEYDRTLQHVAELAVPRFGDMCVVDLLQDGELHRVAAWHVLPGKRPLLTELAARYPATLGGRAPSAQAIASGRIAWLAEMGQEDLAAHCIDDGHATLLAQIGVRHHVAVPMRVRGMVVGALGVSITESEENFDPEDVAILEQLASRAALAVDNATLYRNARDELQRRREAEKALKTAETRARSLMEQSPTSTQRLAPDGRTIGVNRAWERLWGLTLEDLRDYNVLEDPQLHESGIAPLLRQAFAGTPVVLPTIAYDTDRSLPGRSGQASTLRWVSALAYPVRGEDEAIEEVVLVHQDVTDRTQAELRLRDSEDRLRRALTVARMEVWEWELPAAAEQATTMDGWRSRLAHATPYLGELLEEDLPRITQALAMAQAEGVDVAVEYRQRVPEGVRWMQCRGRLELGADGTPVRLLGATLDIHARKEAELAAGLLARAGAALGASLDYRETLAAVAAVVVPAMADWFAVDLLTPQGTLERVVVRHQDPEKLVLAEELFANYPPTPDSDRGAWNILRTGQPEWLPSISLDAVEAAARDARHFALLRGLGLRSYIGVPLRSRGTTIGTLTLVQAESGRAYSEADLQLAEDLALRIAAAVDTARLFGELQERDQRKDEFLAMLAHELRNPLAPITTTASLLALGATPAERVVHYAEVIARQARQLNRLLDDLLDVSRVTRGAISLRDDPLDLRSAVHQGVEQARPMVEGLQHRLAIAMPDAPVVVRGDEARLIQVVANLLTNAARYTPPGGHLAVSLACEERLAVLRFDDDGMGMEPELLGRLFQPFSQGKRTPDRHHGGLGLGLALVHSLVVAHGGSVEGSSPGAGRGSSFVVRLPLSALPARVEPAGTPSVAAASGLRVVVVDDNEDAALTLGELLRAFGHEVALFRDGPALLATGAAPPDVFILDVGLPGMDGYQLVSRLRERHAGAAVAYVALTGYGQPSDRRRSREAGFDHHLVKPLDLDLLAAVLREVPRAGRLETEA